jgi:hypothetical protein
MLHSSVVAHCRVSSPTHSWVRFIADTVPLTITPSVAKSLQPNTFWMLQITICMIHVEVYRLLWESERSATNFGTLKLCNCIYHIHNQHHHSVTRHFVHRFRFLPLCRYLAIRYKEHCVVFCARYDQHLQALKSRPAQLVCKRGPLCKRIILGCNLGCYMLWVDNQVVFSISLLKN